jgi:ParB family transcriptional regulator, chromosome partitioning protein
MYLVLGYILVGLEDRSVDEVPVAEPKAAKPAPSKSEGKPRRKKKATAEPRSRGIAPDAIGSGTPPAAVTRLAEAIAADGGTVLAPYKDPLGGNWQLFAALPIDLVEPTPFQRDLSKPHVERLSSAMDRLGRYLDPMIVVRGEQPGGEGEGRTTPRESSGQAKRPYWTPNGNHRLAALRQLGARSVVAIVVPDIEVAHRILLLNTEKAHNLRERSLEVIRLAELLATTEDRPERDYEIEFEEPALLTLGLCYQENGRFAGGAYHPVLRRAEKWSGAALPKALETRRERAARVLELDAAVTEAMKKLKERGFESPYLRAFVIARINPLRFKRGGNPDVDETIETMLSAARRFDAGRVRADQVARAGGAAEET